LAFIAEEDFTEFLSVVSMTRVVCGFK